MSREPSMEDILSSIRKVIAREDAPTAASPLSRGAPVPPDAEADDSEILELGSEALDADDSASDRELVAPDAAEAARRSLNALSAAVTAPEAVSAAAPIPAGSRTLDDVVTEALRPMLKNWLDTNLPPLVEAMVAKEIARITGRRI
jgi:cell pole-organizing protein PopZ